jgi:hypothetical protein
MFAAECPSIGSPVLIWPSSVQGITNLPDGIEVRYRCACGDSAVWTTGRCAPAGGLVRHRLIGAAA